MAENNVKQFQFRTNGMYDKMLLYITLQIMLSYPHDILFCTSKSHEVDFGVTAPLCDWIVYV